VWEPTSFLMRSTEAAYADLYTSATCTRPACPRETDSFVIETARRAVMQRPIDSAPPQYIGKEQEVQVGSKETDSCC
jgi:hypothetical protein